VCVSSSGGLSRSLVEWLSGKPVQLGQAQPKGRGSWQAGGCGCLMPSWCLSQRCGVPVFPHRAGACQGLRVGEPEGWVSWCSMDLVQPERRGSCCAWVWCRAVVWHSPRGGGPGRMELQVCRPMGQGFGRPAVLLLDCGMKKPSTI
jgi:hypothetical protein